MRLRGLIGYIFIDCALSKTQIGIQVGREIMVAVTAINKTSLLCIQQLLVRGVWILMNVLNITC